MTNVSQERAFTAVFATVLALIGAVVVLGSAQGLGWLTESEIERILSYAGLLAGVLMTGVGLVSLVTIYSKEER